MKIAYPSSILVWILFCDFCVHLCVINCFDIFDPRLPLTLMFPIVWMSLRQSWLLHINAYLLVFVVYFCLYLLCTRCGFPWRFVWWAVRLSLMAASFHLCTSPILCPQRGRDFRQEQDLFVIFAKCISSGRFFIPCSDFSLILEISLREEIEKKLSIECLDT